MLEREFGSTAVKVPVVGQGTWNMKRDGLEALRTGIELGMTHIDTAELYTGAEEIIAEAIRGIRSKIFLVSKVLPSNASYKGTLRACDASLRRLKTDYLDVYLLHWWSGSHPIGETMRAMEERSEEHTSELQSLAYLVCRLLLEKKKKHILTINLSDTVTPRITRII